MTTRAAPFRTSLGLLRMLLIVVVLAARLAGSSMPIAQAAGADDQTGLLAALLDSSVICHAAADDDTRQTPARQPSQHQHDCGLCPACHVTKAAALPVLAAMQQPPSAGSVRIALAALPPATGPPARAWTPSRPRGPPILRI